MQQVISQAARPWKALPATRRWQTAVQRWLPAALVLGGLGLRASLLAQPGLHPDEALYASWALRIADGSDPALLGVAADKPPFVIYVLAALFRLAGAGVDQAVNFAWLAVVGRLAGVAVGVASMGLLYAIARPVYGRQAALLALAGYAVSPLVVRLSPTLFTDTWLVLWVLLALWAALARRAWLAGLACGLAYATKQQAVLFIPLIGAVFLLGGSANLTVSTSMVRPQLRRRHLYSFVWGFLLVAASVLWWDSLRWQWLPSYWERSVATYGALRLAAVQTLPAQAYQWAELLGYLFGTPLLTLTLAAALPLAGWSAWRSRPTWAAQFDLLLLGFAGVYLGLHLLTTIAPWDRYAFAVAPILILLWARGLQQGLAGARAALQRRQSVTAGVAFSACWQRRGQAFLLAGVTAVFAHAAVLAAGPHLPVGDMRAYDGVPAAAAYLRQAQPTGAILYHHWLGWHYAFYLYGAPVELRWWETPPDLAAKVVSRLDQPQFVAIPTGRNAAPLREALRTADVGMEPVLAARHDNGELSLTLYQLHAAASREGSYGE